MKKEVIVRLSASFEEAVHVEQDVEYWMARDLQELFEQQLEAQSRPFRDELAELSIQAAEAQPSSLLSGESPSFRREFFNILAGIIFSMSLKRQKWPV